LSFPMGSRPGGCHAPYYLTRIFHTAADIYMGGLGNRLIFGKL
jgi:hypothetical protein